MTARIVANIKDGVAWEVGRFLEMCRDRYAMRPVQWAQVMTAEYKVVEAIFILKSTASAYDYN